VKGPEHIAIGVASTGLLLYGMRATGTLLSLGTIAAASAAVALGSLAPDIDHRHATIGSRLPAGILSFGLILLFVPPLFRFASSSDGMLAGVWAPLQTMTAAWPMWGGILVAVAMALFLVSSKVTSALGHRGPVHSLLVGGGATVAAVLVGMVCGFAPWYGLLFGFGWVMHLMADATTHDGVPFALWPFVAPATTGGLKTFGFLFLPLVLFGLTGWFFLAATLQASPTAASPGVTAPTGIVSGTPNAALALERLREADPGIADGLTNPNAPVVATSGAYTSYTWQYLRKVAPDSAVVKTITVTLDGSGRIIGVDQS